MAAPLHASVSGTVLDVREVVNQGRKLLACVIQREKECAESSASYRTAAADIREISREEILAGNPGRRTDRNGRSWFSCS